MSRNTDVKECDFIKCGSPLGEYELHCDKETKQQILNNQAAVERIREKIKELDDFQQGYFYENPGRHGNDEEISSLYGFLGEKFTPTTYEEDEQQFMDKMNKQKTMNHSETPQQNFSNGSGN